MTIIIETPQPPIRERLVLVREGEPMAPRRDAEPADLERAGWVPQSALDTQVEATLSNIRRAGHLERERDEARAERDAEIASRDALARVLEQVERERDEARAALVKWQGSAEQERARCVAWLRAEAASSDWASCATWGRALSDTADRLERGEHADTPVPTAEPRATDEELYRVYMASPPVMDTITESTQTALRAVAARVRREQCLVTRAAEAGCDVTMAEHATHEGPGWYLEVRSGPPVRSSTARNVDAAHVAKELARLLGEVTRG